MKHFKLVHGSPRISLLIRQVVALNILKVDLIKTLILKSLWFNVTCNTLKSYS